MFEGIFQKISLEKLCAILVVAGLVVLFFLVVFIEPVSMNISQISEKDIGKIVSINASVENKNLRNGNLFLELGDVDSNSTIKAVMFENDIKQDLSTFQKGSHINIVGRIDRYNGELEIIINKITVIE
ncbi:MAG: OB-fold nucleic acid binding domain-containing protein [Candidatus Aenigmarchaeota archaeon]|nr:OB-fold nucleic acid binding domain-containing protein [Candidatus Aenigmarchaeota archaeon]